MIAQDIAELEALLHEAMAEQRHPLRKRTELEGYGELDALLQMVYWRLGKQRFIMLGGRRKRDRV